MFSVRRLLSRSTNSVAITRGLMVSSDAVSAAGLRRGGCGAAVGTGALLASVRRMTADAQSAASIVIVDPQKAAAERDRIAREMLKSNFPETVNQRSVIHLKGLIHTVPYSLTIALDSVDEKEHVQETAQGILDECFEMVDSCLNAFNSDSEISQVNQLPPGEIHTMSEHLRKVIRCCVEVYRVSGSCFNPASAPLARRLRDAARNPNAVEKDFVISEVEARQYTLPNSFFIDLENGRISRKHSKAELDLGAVNKGYTVDCVVEKLNAEGFPDVLFEWGGDCRASGVNVQRQPWAIGIVRPPTVAQITATARKAMDEGRAPSPNGTNSVLVTESRDHGATEQEQRPMLRVMALNSEALCTSGDYENVLYSRVLDAPVSSTYDWRSRKLLEPSDESLGQVSIKCYNCMYADALATAALVKREPARVRYLMENYRRDFNRVTDYAAYTRTGERLAHMYEIARESPERRAERIASALPARIVVIGSGLAGQSAAIEAATCGAQVILIEKEAKLGGNSAKATSGINGWGTRAQAMARVQDNCKLFERDTFLSGLGGKCDPGLVRTLSVKSADAIQWLTQFGIPLTVLSQLGGHSSKRTHRAPDQKDGTPVPIGFTIMQHLEHHIRTKLQGRVTILTETAVTGLISTTTVTPDGHKLVHVQGVKYQNTAQPEVPSMELPADAVVLATGGFSNDQTSTSLLREFAPHIFGTPTTNGTFATGDGVKMARALGCALVDMDKVQLHPTGLIDPKDPGNKTKFLGPEALRGSGGVLLNSDGERFINELELRSVVSAAINAQDMVYPKSGGSKFAYCVLNEAAAKLFGTHSLGFYWKDQGLFQKVDNVDGLAKLIGCSRDTLVTTLENYEHVSQEKAVCSLTGKSVFPCVLGPQGPFYVAYVTPSIHYTMGGCLISPSAEVLTHNNHAGMFGDLSPILGLLGAGEVTGGVHGKNRLGGNSLLECVVFGKIAGDRAATILQKEKTALSPDKWAPVVVRESRAGDQYGVGSRVLRFNLPGSMQTSGLSVGQFIGVRGEWDGQQLIGYYSPITLPDDRGRISILARGDKGNLQEWISSMRPGDSVEIKACGGLTIDQNPIKKQLSYKKHVIRKFALIAGGSGVAPMLQLIRAALTRPYVDTFDSIRLIYAAEDENELTYRQVLRSYMKENPDKLSVHFVLNNPPEGWTDGVGYVQLDSIKRALQPPAKDLLVAICGPPVMQNAVKEDLLSLGYNPALTHTIDEDRVN